MLTCNWKSDNTTAFGWHKTANKQKRILLCFAISSPHPQKKNKFISHLQISNDCCKIGKGTTSKVFYVTSAKNLHGNHISFTHISS